MSSLFPASRHLSREFKKAFDQELNQSLNKLYNDLPSIIEKMKRDGKEDFHTFFAGKASASKHEIYKTQGYKQIENYCRENDYRLWMTPGSEYGQDKDGVRIPPENIMLEINIFISAKYLNRFQRKMTRIGNAVGNAVGSFFEPGGD